MAFSTSCRDVFAAVAPGTLLNDDGTVFQRGTMPRSRSLDDLDLDGVVGWLCCASLQHGILPCLVVKPAENQGCGSWAALCACACAGTQAGCGVSCPHPHAHGSDVVCFEQRPKAFFDAHDSDDSDDGEAGKGWEDLAGMRGKMDEPEQRSSLLLCRSRQAKRTLRIQIAPLTEGVAAAPTRYVDDEVHSPYLHPACASPTCGTQTPLSETPPTSPSTHMSATSGLLSPTTSSLLDDLECELQSPYINVKNPDRELWARPANIEGGEGIWIRYFFL